MDTDCIVCDRKVPGVFPDVPQPAGGVSFTAYGNYGSAVFDPWTDIERLIITVCDDCLILKKSHVTLAEVIRARPEFIYSEWTPGLDTVDPDC